MTSGARSFAEVVLRVGVSVGGWLIFIAHALLLAALPQADCDPTSDLVWRGTLLFGVLCALGLIGVGSGLAWREQLRWIAAIGVGFAVLAAFAIAPAVAETTLSGRSLCLISGPVPVDAPASGSMLERAWPPFQLAVLTFGVWQAFRTWRHPVRP